jgi:hypothetical protein
VVERKQNMIDGFIKCLRSNDLLVWQETRCQWK